ncbi:helix-turn-helix domain-containing protein [Klebsiella quasivariicola]|uniref:helix-turn-helix domain-containing protein n=1 Tax=Klebsiella quasivariicola TaxID=2026240 RepID=UPI00247AE39A|nr:helix-turn-helix transcriptional regulator [Klebsiella quasivariicola]
MVYIISDDVYFSLGLTCLLHGAGFETYTIDKPSTAEYTDWFCSDDIVLVDAQSVVNYKPLIDFARLKLTRVVFMYSLELKMMNNPLFFSTKIRIDTFLNNILIIQSLDNYRVTPNYIFSSLTVREKFVMRLASSIWNINRIAKILNISDRTVYAYRNSALKKIGLKKLNAVAMLIYKQVFLSEY